MMSKLILFVMSVCLFVSGLMASEQAQLYTFSSSVYSERVIAAYPLVSNGNVVGNEEFFIPTDFYYTWEVLPMYVPYDANREYTSVTVPYTVRPFSLGVEVIDLNAPTVVSTEEECVPIESYLSDANDSTLSTGVEYFPGVVTYKRCLGGIRMRCGLSGPARRLLNAGFCPCGCGCTVDECTCMNCGCRACFRHINPAQEEKSGVK